MKGIFHLVKEYEAVTGKGRMKCCVDAVICKSLAYFLVLLRLMQGGFV